MNKIDTVNGVMESLVGRDISTKEHRSIAKRFVLTKDEEWLLEFVDSAITFGDKAALNIACWILPYCEKNGVDGVWNRFLKVAETDMWEVREEASHCFRLMLGNRNSDYFRLVDSYLDRLTIYQLRAIAVGFVRFISERYTTERKLLRRIVECCLSTDDKKLQKLVAKFVIGDYLYYCLPQEALRFAESWVNDRSAPQKMKLAAESFDAASASQFSPLFVKMISDLMKSDDNSIRQIAERSAKRHFVKTFESSFQGLKKKCKVSNISNVLGMPDLVQSLPTPRWLSETYGDDVIARLSQIANQVDTPFIIIFEGCIVRQIQALQGKMPAKFLLRYGGKAWFHPWLVYEVKNCGLHVCASSKEEVQIALLLGFRPDAVHFMQPGCSEFDLMEVQKSGVRITIDSERQADIICRIKATAKNRDIGLRLSLTYIPSIEEAVVRPSPPVRFGISPDDVPRVVEKLNKYGYRVSEVMGHAGSLIWNPYAFVSIVRELSGVVPYLDNPLELNIGGGFPFRYVDECPQIDFSVLFKLLSAEQVRIARTMRNDVKIILEPARLLSAPCALQVTRITDIKTRTSKSRFVFCDAVLNSLGLSLPVSVLHHKKDGTDWSKDVLVSNLCAPNDLISKHIGGKAHVGELAAIGGIGGYVMPLSHSLQGRTKPTEVVLHSSGSWSIIRRPIPNLSLFQYVQ